ncbi:MAG: FkbM family methyltransferase [Dolichospermum sp.]
MNKQYKVARHNLFFPHNHKLEQYQNTWKLYDRILGIIAKYVFVKYPDTTAIDIGANVGDTAALIQEFQPIPTLCIEGNPEYFSFLERNAQIIGNIEIAYCFIGKDGETVDLEKIVSQNGTTSINNALGKSGENISIMQSLASVIEEFSPFKNSKILKIDTDGLDLEIIRMSKDVIGNLKPVVYFEYDISFNIKNNSLHNALNILNFLRDLGYRRFMIFDNFGNHISSLYDYDQEHFFNLTNYLVSNIYKSGQPAIYYFDICAFHAEDIDIFQNVYDHVNETILQVSNHLNNSEVHNFTKKIISDKPQSLTNTFISYAQNSEDVLLNRLFKYKTRGFYIDVGALHPTFDSVTKAFYDRGWSGINIEPIKELFNVFEKERPRDINLNIAVSNLEGNLEFFEVVGQWGNSTLNKEIADEIAKQKDLDVSQYTVTVKTLASICKEYVNQEIDFLKIDVEGLEEDVILGGNWEIFRPTVLVIETTQPNTNIRCQNNIPQILTDKGYKHVFFDGINDYYIAAESEDLAKHFAYPVNILDFYVNYRFVEQQRQINELNRILNSINNSMPTIQTTNLESVYSENINLLKPTILIDGVFFQLYQTGIARVWRSLLEQWVNTEFADHIVVLDRANTAPKINGIRYRTIPGYDYNNTEADKQMLQQICNEEAAELFISTYYTTPIETPSVFMAYDMIPEVLRVDLNQPMWREKHHGIKHASAYISISENTAKDLNKCFPDIPLESITVAHCGVDPLFSPASESEINAFKYQYGITKPYFLLVGTGSGYKNGILFFQAFAKLATSNGFDIICTGIGGILTPELRTYTLGSAVHLLQLSDKELALAYSGAVTLVYPSKYEGFGMPLLEAMACGCPVITCPNASIPEVTGEAAIYVNDNDVSALANALCDVQKPNIRKALITAGLAQSKNFSWTKMAKIVSSELINTTLLPLNLREINLIIFPDWTQAEDELGLELQQVIETLANHPENQKITLIIHIGNLTIEDAEMFLSSVAMNLLMADLDISDTIEISLIDKLGNMQWQSLLPRIYGRVILSNEDKITLAQMPVSNLKSYQLDSLISQF